MKAIIKLTFLFLLSISLTNCSNDDNSDQNSFDSFIVFEGNTTVLDKGYVHIDDHHAFLKLFSPNNDIGQQVQGLYIYIGLFSEDAASILEGTYNVNNNTQEQTHYFDTALFINNDTSPIVTVYTENGTVEVTQGGLDNLSLTFDVIDDLGNHITGKWSGNLMIVN